MRQLSFRTTTKPRSFLIFDFLMICMNDPKFLSLLGARIRTLRMSKEMTQNELANQCEFEKASMSRIEGGKTNITILTLRKISRALDIDIAEFLMISTDGEAEKS